MGRQVFDQPARDHHVEHGRRDGTDHQMGRRLNEIVTRRLGERASVNRFRPRCVAVAG